jgi:hypothetical protein
MHASAGLTQQAITGAVTRAMPAVPSLGHAPLPESPYVTANGPWKPSSFTLTLKRAQARRPVTLGPLPESVIVAAFSFGAAILGDQALLR